MESTSPRGRRRLIRWLLALAALGLVAVIGVAAWVNSRLRASLPKTSGRVVVAGLSGPIRIDRDALGVPTIRSATREGLARGLRAIASRSRFLAKP